METALQKIAASDKFAELMLTKGNAPDFLTGADARKKLEVMAGATAPILDAIRAGKLSPHTHHSCGTSHQMSRRHLTSPARLACDAHAKTGHS